MSSIGPTELVVILVIVILLYALGRLPEFGGALGKGIGEFKQAVKDGKPGSGIASHANTDEGANTASLRT